MAFTHWWELGFSPLFDVFNLLLIRKKVIGLDELLADFYNEKSKNVEKESKRRAKAPKKCVFDEEQDAREASLCKLVDECQTQADN